MLASNAASTPPRRLLRCCRQRTRARRVLAAAVQGGGSERVDGLPSPCDDFECRSSPMVEVTLRQIARDQEGQREGVADRASLTAYAENVLFTDSSLRRGVGRARLAVYTPTSLLTEPQARVTSIALETSSSARVRWTLSGRSPAGPVCLACSRELQLNLISSRVLKQHEEWSFATGTAPLAAVVYTAQRLALSAAANLSDAAGMTGDYIQDAVDSLRPQEDIFQDPTDPRRYIQTENTFVNDAVTIILAVTIIWLLVRALVM